VGKARQKVWVWVALDRDTREIVAVHLGNRSRTSAKALWQALPPLYRQCAVCYTDAWEAYQGVVPATRHRVVAKDSVVSKRVCKRVKGVKVKEVSGVQNGWQND
jgi:insertion element IS1 protein InsB